MYQDVYMAKDWNFTDPIAVKVIYNLFTEQGYASNHRIIEPDKYIFFYTMEGAGSFTVDDRQLMVGANSIVVINAKRNLHYHCAGPQWNFWLFEFKTPNMIFIPNKVYLVDLGKPALSLCTAAMQNLKWNRPQSAAALFQSFYYTCYQTVQKGLPSRTHLLLNSALLYMRENINRFSVAELCSYLNIEERTLRNIFMRKMNTTPKKHFEFLRLEESKRYLEASALSIADIAARLGFANPGHFSTAFRKDYGVTPKQYRLAFNANVESEA